MTFRYKYNFRCKICGDIIPEDIRDDNHGLCDYCYHQTHLEEGYISIGEYQE